jgi:hypothetical protein
MTRAWRKWSGGRRRVLAAAVTAVAAGGLALAAEPAQAASLCVGGGGGCYPTIQAAVDAAHAGDTITIGIGTFAGGVTITKSLSLHGSGAASTVIRGGDHVLTIGAYGAASEPTVSISDVTVTGGLARSSPVSVPLFGKAGAWAAGGGIEIPPGAHLADGATVTISDSVITGNRANPSTSIPSGISCPGGFPQGQCPFAPANGGGIDSWGALTLIRTAVTGNRAGAAPGQPGTTSDADGGGIFSRQGSLTLDYAIVSGNRATAASPAGRFAEGGGIWAGVPDFEPGSGSGRDVLVIKDSVISGNTSSLSTDLPAEFGGQVQNLVANGGGVIVAGHTPTTTVENTVISKNTAIATTPNGAGGAIDAGMFVTAGSLDMSGSVVSGNRDITEAAHSDGVGSSGSALEVDGGGTISNTRITGNFSSMDSPHSAAGTSGALGIFGNDSLLTVRDSVISGNTATATSSTGSADVQGVGVFNGGLLTLVNDTISGNSGKATGPSGSAQGGGIWNSTDVTAPPVQLTLEHTTVTHNSVSGSHGITVQGGGLFSAPPATVVLRDSLITLNVPDQCSGC